MRESKVEKAISQYAWHYKVANYKFTSPGSIGVPDRVFISKRGTFFIEFKAPGRTLDPAQISRVKEMRQAGAIIFVVDDIAFGKRVVDGYTVFQD